MGNIAEEYRYLVQTVVGKVINDPDGAIFHSPRLRAIEPASLVAGFLAVFSVIMKPNKNYKMSNNNKLR